VTTINAVAAPLFQEDRSQSPRHVRAMASDAAFPAIEQSILICGDATRAMGLLPSASVQTVLTSPPYWSLRDYRVEDQLGCDDDLQAYINSIVTMFAALRRVLRDDGTVWLNIGDAFTSGNRRYRAPDRKNRARAMGVRPPTPAGLKAKDLIGLPWRLALALQHDGWWLRSEVIWHKTNAHPESVRDRPTKAHETIFLLSKSQDYHYNIHAFPVRAAGVCAASGPFPPSRSNGRSGDHADDHPAMMPMGLAVRCLSITGTANGIVLDPYAGAGTTLLAAEQLGQRWVGVEVKPSFVDLIEQRLPR